MNEKLISKNYWLIYFVNLKTLGFTLQDSHVAYVVVN